MKPFLRASFSLAVGLGLGVCSNLSSIWATSEYQSETIRGTSELKAKGSKGNGLDKKYAFDWKYGVGETITLLVQNAAGGGASQTHAGTKVYDAVYPQIAESLSKNGLTTQQIEKQADQQISSLFYTGNQPFVGVSIYWGAIFIFAFISGLFLIKSRYKWWIAVSTLMMIMVAWGDNFFFADLMFDYFPMFNKFRAVTQALGMGQLMCILLAMMTLQAWFDPKIARDEKMKALLYGTGITALFCFIGMAGSVDGKQDLGLKQPELVNMLRTDRGHLMKTDGFRSLMLVLLAAGLIWAYLNQKVSKTWTVMVGLGLLTFLDTWTIAKRILHDNKFEEPKTFTDEQKPTDADKIIMADKDPHFRVLDLRQGLPFTNAQTSAYHKSVGGYHPAKLMRYQELVEKYLGDFKQNIAVQNMPNMPIYGMLNTKYILMPSQNGREEVIPNAFAMGNAWFVKKIQVANDGDAELDALAQTNLKETAVVQKSYLGNLANFTPQYDSTNNIKLTAYHPDKMQYEYSAKTEQVVVFSETYYPESKGWGLFLGNQRIPLTKANFTLRAAKLPAGQQQKLEMRFEPKSYYQGETMSRFASASLLLLFFGSLFQHFRQNGLSEAATLPENPPIPEEPTPAKTPAPTPTKSATNKRK